VRAEDVMRARYSAYVLGLRDFLHDSWHPAQRPAVIDLDPSIRWTGLTVLESSGGGVIDVTGEVRFVALYVQHGHTGALAEHSRFERLPAGWVYVAAIA
jgi:SEC-C motif-containing protein